MVFGQVTRPFEATEDNMKKYSALAKILALCFKATWFEKIERRQNKKQMIVKSYSREGN